MNRFARSALPLLAVLVCRPIAADDPEPRAPAVDRLVAKSPPFASSRPGYGLVLLGPKADTSIWLMKDGDALYVDRDADGDLTDRVP